MLFYFVAITLQSCRGEQRASDRITGWKWTCWCEPLAFSLLSIIHMLTAGLFSRILFNIFNASFYHLIIEGIYICKFKCVFVVSLSRIQGLFLASHCIERVSSKKWEFYDSWGDGGAPSSIFARLHQDLKVYQLEFSKISESQLESHYPHWGLRDIHLRISSTIIFVWFHFLSSDLHSTRSLFLCMAWHRDLILSFSK